MRADRNDLRFRACGPWLSLTVRAIFSPPTRKRALLEAFNRLLEQLRVLWRFCNDRGWISRQQLVFIVGKIDEAGRMTGGWRRSLGGENA